MYQLFGGSSGVKSSRGDGYFIPLYDVNNILINGIAEVAAALCLTSFGNSTLRIAGSSLFDSTMGFNRPVVTRYINAAVNVNIFTP